MKKILFVIFLTTLFDLAIINCAVAEIVEVKNEEKNFGDWKVFCEIDDMMDIAHCKIAAKFYDNASVITLQPSVKFVNQLFFIIPKIQIGSFLKIRVDHNDLILSKNMQEKDFGLVPLDDQQKNSMFLQMKGGDFLFLRFSIRGSDKEATIKLNLKDFRSALNYYHAHTSNKAH